MSPSGYRPIADYAAIGNLQSVALVAPDGSIDWCCLPDFDSPSYFAALLDARGGGRFRVRPAGAGEATVRYVDHTNVLESIFHTATGRLVLSDYMPIEGDIDGRPQEQPPPAIYRLLHAEGGPVEVDVEWSPRPDYARGELRMAPIRHGFEAAANGRRLVLQGLRDGEVEISEVDRRPVLRARLALAAGERRVLVTGLNEEVSEPSVEDAIELLRRTEETWRDWVHKGGRKERSWARPHEELVTRSELVLKVLCYGPTGAIVAAPTTSLPEWIGGVRNWDYRYAWIRDASLTVQALHAVGHREEAREFILWAERTAGQAESGDQQRVQPLYCINGETDAPEEILGHLAGYRDSPPVRIGNEAAKQVQLDVYGELLDGAYELVREGAELPDDVRRMLVEVADMAVEQIDQPDDSIWEVRNGPDQFTYTKLMLWVAFDRAVQLVEAGVLPERGRQRWERAREQVRRAGLERGFDRAGKAFVQRLDGQDLDASLLLIPLHELLPASDERVQSTINRIIDELTEHNLVYRYNADDGVGGDEGAFVLCSFWLVDALALSGRLDEAHAIYDSLVRRVNHVGLLAEQINPASGEFLGNFPQAFSHLGLLNSAIYLAHAEGREMPISAPVGTREHRRQAASARR
ncbi:MAG TPA: glycoside hydrolase family 15 protein [Candidatus Limnocylindria bacterium]|nr:glycoside hydrolase family 15 protein [Candidatus Limnocylindria bacterium]